MHRLALLFVLFLISLPAHAQDITTSAKQAYIIDYETGTVLFKKNETERMPTSSMSKVMTMLEVFEALEDGRLKLDDELLVSEKAWKKGGSKMFVRVNTKVNVEDLIRGVIIQSGNDATIVLAEALSGSEDAFAKKITKLAKEIGMDESNFTNASGWPDPNHYSTAKDLSIMARYLIGTYGKYYSYYNELSFEYNEIEQDNRNPLLYKNIGADGIKTGHTEAGGYGLVGSGVRDGRRVIIVLNGMESKKERGDESTRLLEWALRNFRNKTLFTSGQVIASADVVLGAKEVVSLSLKDDIRLTVPLASADEISASLEYKTPLIAPITKGSELGTLTIYIPNYGKIERPVYATYDIHELGFFAKTYEKFKLFLKQNL